MMTTLPLLSSVALLEDLAGQGLSRGQIGTVVEHLECGEERALLVEFADENGETLALATLAAEQVIALHRRPQAA